MNACLARTLFLPNGVEHGCDANRGNPCEDDLAEEAVGVNTVED